MGTGWLDDNEIVSKMKGKIIDVERFCVCNIK